MRSAMHRLRSVRPDVRMLLDEEPDVVVADVDAAMMELVIVVLLENALRFARSNTDVCRSCGSMNQSLNEPRTRW